MRYVTWDTCPVCLRYRPPQHYPRVGVEPITFYCFGPSKKPRQRDFLLLTLTKLGGATWSRTKIVYPEGTDLQSADAHALASIAPKLAPVAGIEPTTN